MRHILLFLILIIQIKTSKAQLFELGMSGGGLTYIGDLNQDMFFMNTEGGFGAFFQITAFDRLAFNANFIYGNLSAHDKNSNRYETQKRNLNFYSELIEFSLNTHLNLLKFNRESPKNTFTPYLSAGISIFSFDPKTKYMGQEYALQSIGTEGQGLDGYPSKYALVEWGIPLGFGIKLLIGDRLIFGIDLGYRITFTDYLDDVSTLYLDPAVLIQNGNLAVALSNRTEEFTGQSANNLIGTRRGNPNNNDAYMYWNIRLSFVLNKKIKAEKNEQRINQMLNKWL